MVGDSGVTICCTGAVVVVVLAVLMSSNEIHKRTVKKVKTDTKRRSRSFSIVNDKILRLPRRTPGSLRMTSHQ